MFAADITSVKLYEPNLIYRSTLHKTDSNSDYNLHSMLNMLSSIQRWRTEMDQLVSAGLHNTQEGGRERIAATCAQTPALL